MKGHQGCVLEVLGEQRVSLSVWVCHYGRNFESYSAQIRRRDRGDVCLPPRPGYAASARGLRLSPKPWHWHIISDNNLLHSESMGHKNAYLRENSHFFLCVLILT